MKYSIYLLFLVLVFSSCSDNTTLLFEAEEFQEKGGWLVDPQFVEQMGSPYLLAHGLGKPVENAITTVEFARGGYYHVWVRTMNWVPGNWKAPGTFKIVVDGKELEQELGTIKGWNWQYAGRVKTGKSASLELVDLTGFEARCDAIAFSKKKQSPPSEAIDLSEWRKNILNQKKEPENEQEFDLVITGGGIAGCAAAIAAAEMGLKVALIHDRPILGGNASSEIRVHTEGVTGDYDRILSKLNTVHWPNGSPDAAIDDKKRHENVEKYENINLFLEWRAFATVTENDSILAIDAKHTSMGETMRFRAPVYIDCTGDGWIGYWSGAEYMYGREAVTDFGEHWEEHGELWSPDKADNVVMGSSVLWRTKKVNKESDFPELPWAKEVSGEFTATAGTWNWEYTSDSLNQVDDAEAIRDHMFRAIYGSFSNFKNQKGDKNIELEWMSYLIGKRESRRLVGDYIFTFKDVVELQRFEDEVVYGVRPVDVHYQQYLLDPDKPDFLSEALFYYVDYYYIPFRSLYSKNIKNLMMAGRNFSCSHIGLGGPRVMNTTGQMGAATGFAASLCIKYSISPREVYGKHIEELKKIIQDQK